MNSGSVLRNPAARVNPLVPSPVRPAENPFATARVERELRFRPEWSGVDGRALVELARTPGPPLAVVGRHGSGKTTLFDWLAGQLANAGETVARVVLNEAFPPRRFLAEPPPPPLPGSIVLLDGEDLATWRQRRKLRRWCAPARRVLLARHSPGRYPVAAELVPSPALLRDCVRLLAAAHAERLDPLLDRWFLEERGNLRHCLLRCYDWVGGPRGATGSSG